MPTGLIFREAHAAIAEVEKNAYAEPISVPRNNSPFTSHNDLQLFANLLHQHQIQGCIPSGYGMLRGEWEGGIYPTIQHIPPAREDLNNLEWPSKQFMATLIRNVGSGPQYHE